MILFKKLISLALVLSLGTAFAKSSQIGHVYKIAEPDALEEIEQRASRVDFGNELSKSRQDWTSIQTAYLPETQEERIRKYIPWYTTKFDIKNEKGQIIYPKGFRFNPLQYAKMPQRIVAISQSNYQKIKSVLKESDLILITEGDPITLSEKEKRPFFILDEQAKERLGLQVQPSIITQHDTYFEINEILGEERLHES